MEANNFSYEKEEKLHFLDYWQVISKRKEVIIATFIIIVFVVAVWSIIQKPIYSAYTRIKVEAARAGLDPFIPETYRYMQFDPIDFQTHYNLIQSEVVLEKVVKNEIYRTLWQCNNPLCRKILTKEERVNLTSTECPECGGGRIERKNVRKYNDVEPLTIAWARRDKADQPYPVQIAINMLRKNLNVQQEKGTKLIDIIYYSKDRREAALMANMIADAHMEFAEEENRKNLDKALTGLLDEIDRTWSGTGKREGLEVLQERLGQFKEEKKLLIGQHGGLLETVDLTGFRTQLDQLRLEIIARDTNLNRLNQLDMEEKISSMYQYDSINDLKRLLFQQEDELSQALVGHGEEHPVVKGIRERVKEIKQKLDKEVNGIIGAMENDLEALKKQKEELEKIIETSQDEIFEKEKDLREYERRNERVARLNAIYQQMIQKETMEFVKKSIPATTISLQQEAFEPLFSVRPKRLLNIIIGVIVGLVVGTGLAYFIEYLDTSVKTIDDLERSLNLPILGVIPQKVKLLTEENIKSPAYEAYRMLWTNIEFAKEEKKIKTILITSGGVGEGKTTTLVNLGIAAAQSGKNVLLVDSDFRRPRMHKLLEVSNSPGLTDILLKNADPDSVTVKTKVDGLSLIPSGKLPPSIAGLLGSQKMRECVSSLYDKYDIILFDSPPVLGMSDSSIMANIADRVLLVVEYRKHPKSVAVRAKRVLENIGGELLGGVINNLNVMKEDYYYYSQVYHYMKSPEEEAEEAAEEGEEVAEGDEEKESSTLAEEEKDKDEDSFKI